MEKNSESLGKKIKYLRILLHVLLRFKEPTDEVVVAFSQQLDEYIVKYQKKLYSSNYAS